MKSASVIVTLLLCVLCAGCASTETGSESAPSISQRLWPDVDPFDPNRSLFIELPSMSYGESQQASNWCWAACVASTVNGLVGKRVLTQDQVVADLFGGMSPDRGASIEQITNAINGRQFSVPFEYGGRSMVYTINTVHIVSGLPSWEFLEYIADGNHAAIAVLPGHAVVVTGASNMPVDSVKTLNIDDPWPRRGRRSIQIAEAVRPDSSERVLGMIVVRLDESIR